MPEKFYQHMQYVPIYIAPHVAKNPQILKELVETCVKKIAKQIEVYRGALGSLRIAAKGYDSNQVTVTCNKVIAARMLLLHMMADLEIVVDKYYGD